MQASDFTRYDCQVGKKRRSYETLRRDYRCNECGGGLRVQWSDDEDAYPDHWFIECAHCGGTDFIHQAQAERNKQLAREMFKNLPEAIVQSYMERRTEQCQRK